MKITDIKALEVLDSRGNPTIKAYVTLDDTYTGAALVPSGASTGTHEALELRDADNRYHGKGVQKAIRNITGPIFEKLKGESADSLADIDRMMLELDDTENKSNLGANAILGVSLALARAKALALSLPLWKLLNNEYFNGTTPAFPQLTVNVINGGAHANWTLDFQEFMLVPTPTNPSESVRMASEVFHSLKKKLKEEGHTVSVGDEGGFAPKLKSADEAFTYLKNAIKDAGYTLDQIGLATDIAASEFYKDGTYNLKVEGKTLTSQELASYYGELMQNHAIISLEDPFAEDDWDGFTHFTERYGKDHVIVGDDLLVTNPKRIQKAIDAKACNAVLIKVNQIGSLFEAVEAIKLARDAGWKFSISHRSGETEDSFIADLAYASAADYIKTGSMSRSERLAKYNRLLEIETLEVGLM